ncbi:MAG: tRNA (adenosine(37)-N6)-threonylcarbamoyltransferase complex transferase subunit TsaD, partial [Cetobacterium sp.]
KGDKNALKIPEPKVDGYNFSFSGIKTSVINAVNKAKMKGEEFKAEDLSAAFQDRVVDILCKKTLKAVQDKGVKQILIAGGVAANSLLRSELSSRAKKMGVKVAYPSMSYCTDNAAMIAEAAYYKLKYGKGTIFADLTLNGKATLDIMKD